MALTKHVVAVAVVAVAFLLAGLIYTTWTLRSHGRVIGINVSVFQDAGLATPLTEIDWGFLAPGDSKNYTGYVLNNGNVPVNLTCYSQDWTPINASTFITLNAYFDDSVLLAGQSTPVTWELIVDPSVTGIDTFEFNLIVVGSYDVP